MQFYFICELKRVRLYFEAKSTLELDMKLRSFRRFLTAAAICLGISCTGTIVIFIVDNERLFDSKNAPKFLSSFMIALMIVTILVWQSSS